MPVCLEEHFASGVGRLHWLWCLALSGGTDVGWTGAAKPILESQLGGVIDERYDEARNDRHTRTKEGRLLEREAFLGCLVLCHWSCLSSSDSRSRTHSLPTSSPSS